MGKDIPLIKINKLLKGTEEINTDDSLFSIFQVADAPRRLREENPFRNDFYAIIFITKGEVKFSLDFSEHLIKPGQVLFVTPGQVVSSVDNSEDGFGVIFRKDFLMRQGNMKWLQGLPIFHKFHSEPFITLDKDVTLKLTFQLTEILKEYHKSADYKYDAIKANLILILVQLSRLYADVNHTGKSEHNTVVMQFEFLINEHFRETRSVKDYGEMLFMTPQNLNRICKSKTGKSASELINDKLLIEIKRYLIYTDKSIDEVAYSLGFMDNSYFTKYFKRATGKTPSQYRSKNRKSSFY